MKHIAKMLFAVLLLGFPAEQVLAQSMGRPEETAGISFDRTLHDFGSLSQGKRVSTSFVVTNTGRSPLVIASAISSCPSCLRTELPTAPIRPGQSGTLKVTLDTTGMGGSSMKSITIGSNAVNPVTLTIKANVQP